MQYTEVTIHLSKLDPFRDMLIYSLGDEGPYDSFDETSDGLKAYVPTNQYDESYLKQCIDELLQLDGTLDCRYEVAQMVDKDYNEEWEKQHQAVLVGDFCWVRAPFHPKRDDVKYDIVIEPKMSFGTAHHATTYLMLTFLEELDLVGKSVLDMGSGTGVLAILAAKKGAKPVVAVDVDEWAYRNAVENFERNNVDVAPKLGDASLLTGETTYDVVLANINRNILLHDMEAYIRVMRPGAMLMLSGFYEHDIEALSSKCSSLGLNLINRRTRNDWAALQFQKP